MIIYVLSILSSTTQYLTLLKNMGMFISLQIANWWFHLLCVCILPGTKVAGSYGSSISNFFGTFYALFHSGYNSHQSAFPIIMCKGSLTITPSPTFFLYWRLNSKSSQLYLQLVCLSVRLSLFWGTHPLNYPDWPEIYNPPTLDFKVAELGLLANICYILCFW